MPARQAITAPVGIVAGAGVIPLLLAQGLVAQKRSVFVVGIEGSAGASLKRYPHKFLSITALGRCIKALKENGCKEVVLIGAIVRPTLRPQALDWAGIKVAGKIAVQKALGDGRLLDLVVQAFEEKGLRVRAVEHFLPDLLAGKGVLGRVRPNTQAQKDIARGLEVTKAVGRLDIGQAVVVCRGQVLGVEGVDGTDALLRRIAKLPASLRGTQSKRAGVLVKLPKPKQDRRVDLPTLGATTLRLGAQAGLAGVVYRAGGILLVQQDKCVTLADKAGMFLFGQK